MVATEIVSTRISRPLRSSAPKPVEAHVATHQIIPPSPSTRRTAGGDQHAFERQEVELLDAARRQKTAGSGIAPDDEGKRNALHADHDRERPDD